MKGFELTETMDGYHYFLDDLRGTKRKMSFEVIWGTDDIKRWLTPQPDCFMVNNMVGTVTIEGLCEEVLVEGKLILDYFGRGTITYEFMFRQDGTLYYYKGEKVNIKPWNLLTSHTTCVGTLYNTDTGQPVSNSVTFFKFKNAFSFLKSFKLV